MPATIRANPRTVCRAKHRRNGRTAPARRIAPRPAADWRRPESSPAAPPCRAIQERGYKGEAGTCRDGLWSAERTIVRKRILIRDRPGGTASAHDPPKVMRFGEQIMRRFNSLARDLGTSEGVYPAKPVAAF